MANIFLPLIYILSERFYDSVEILQHPADLVLVVVLFLLPYSLYKMNINFILDNKFILGFFTVSFLLSIFMAQINFGQSLTVSIWASRIFLIYILLFLVLTKLIKQVNLNSIYNFVLGVSFFLIIFNFYLYLSGDFQYYFGKVIERFGDTRFLVGGTSIIYFYLFLLANKNFKRFSLPIAIGLLITVAMIAKTRSLLFPLLFITVLPFINLKKIKNIFQILLIFMILSFASFLSGDNIIMSPIQNLFELSADDVAKGGGNISFRFFTFLYFFENLNPISILFGYGMEADRVALYYDRFYLTDLGIFKVFYYHGIIGFSLYVFSLKSLYDQSIVNNSPMHYFGRYFVYFQFLAPTLTIVYTITGVLFFLITYIHLKNINGPINA
jgi:hypothetical protein